MKIRLANKTDLLKVSRLWLYMVQELDVDKSLEPNVTWWRDHAAKFMDSGNYFMQVAELGGKIVGFIDYFIFPEPATSKLHCVGQHFYVLPEYRRAVISGKLWKLAIQQSKKLGAQVHELFCFESEKPFWQKHGFVLKRCLVRK